MTNNFTVGVRELPGLNSLEVNPNPAQSGQSLNVEINISESLKADLRLYNIHGQLMHTGQLNLNVGANVYALNTSGLSNGVYVLTVENQEGISQKKIIITK